VVNECKSEAAVLKQKWAHLRELPTTEVSLMGDGGGLGGTWSRPGRPGRRYVDTTRALA